MRPRKYLLPSFMLLSLLLITGFARTTPAQNPSTTPAPGSTLADGVARITLDEFRALLASGKPVTVIDVRGGINSKIKGAVNIPLGDLETRLAEVPRDREIVTYCA